MTHSNPTRRRSIHSWRSLLLAAAMLLPFVCLDAVAYSSKPVKTVTESELKDACDAIGGSFSPSRHKGDGYACDRPDGETGVECHPGAGCEEFDVSGKGGAAPTRLHLTAPMRPGSTTATEATPPEAGPSRTVAPRRQAQ